MRMIWQAFLAVLLLSTAARADGVLIFSNDFNRYLSTAKPGDVFTVAPGVYQLKRSAKLMASGTREEPIIIRPADPTKKTTILVDTTIGFAVTGAHWIIEGFDIIGICDNDSQCEHAFHITGHADDTVIRNNRLIDFNAAIKGNGIVEGGQQYFPDRVIIEHNQIYNRRPRETRNPVAPLDVVGGRFWTVRQNFIADFEKAGGNHISYAGFLKGNSDNGLFERNLVVCEWRFKGGIRLGLSFGGGGTTNPQFCQGHSCALQHYKGVMRSNIIMNCPADVGVYLNNAANTIMVNNTILNTKGVDVRFNGSFALFANNIIEGRIKSRDDGNFREEHDLVEESLSDTFPNLARFDLTPADPDDVEGAAHGYNGVDFCTGQIQEDAKGAMAVPSKCSVQAILDKYAADMPK
ncbi:right-handed parallel beta-helix repeat-containing protein [Kordiimonas marina]|uniref:right-handed parallel beta-helix repeat-containing protein n=1 Tax=Kordiimonas marina TaxID=2872312 RepID=UPI001FF5C025|nr:right-handed parallel beta-helix repeat-containing protein [Kordiimonas marina]MCJ9430594.1 right-handed parallel beta-helix repeat-containing protein [Kordiimonas marina]